MSDKVLPIHTQRRAVVYLRQSTLKQVHQHQESTQRQYALRQRAVQLGWSAEAIDVLDEDLGLSGAGTSWRPGFQRLAEDVAHGRVGGILALEVSRLARSSADWHRLLELCGLADVVIIDEQAVYSPRDYNDRLLLGLKGTMSEAEQYWMRLRLEGGRLAKARRGELYQRPPAGYEWDAAARRFRFDPDEGVQRAIRLVFDLFRREGSAYAVTRQLARSHLLIPTRDWKTGELRWRAPKPARVLRILHSPVYAGAYVFGRTEERMGLVDGHVRRRLKRRFAQSAWKTCLRERHPGYITWEEYMANQRKLEDNRTAHGTDQPHGAAHAGSALLQGLVLCGRCGHPMSTRYAAGSRSRGQYICLSRHLEEKVLCFAVPARAVDAAVTRLFLDTVQPAEVDLSLAVAHHAEQQVRQVDMQWKARLERVRYEAHLAERRYKAVDPDNRVVARTLEREWEEALQQVREVEEEYAHVRQQQKLQLSEEDRLRLLKLSGNLTEVWNAETTTNADRKNLLRMLVRAVTLSPVDRPQRQTRIQVLWQTGAVSELTTARPNRYQVHATPRQAVETIRQLFGQKLSDAQIAQQLNQHHLQTGQQRDWTTLAVRRIRYAEGIYRPLPKGHIAPKRRADGLYSVHGVAARLGVTQAVVRQWVQLGLLTPADGGGSGRPRWFSLDAVTLARLKEAKAAGKGSAEPQRIDTVKTDEVHYA